MKKNKKVYAISIFIAIIIISITIGYSAFGTEMNIDGATAKIRLEENIRVTAFSVENTVQNAYSSYEDYNISNLLTEVTLPQQDSSITYKVTVTNFGNQEMGVLSIENLPDSLEYQLTDYQLKEKICNNNSECTLGAKKEFFITLKYKDNVSPTETNYTLNLVLDFRPFHKISYIGIDDTSYPKEIIDSGDLSISLSKESSETLKVYNEKNEEKYYTYENSILTISNIKENIIIEKEKDLSDKDFIITNDSEIEIYEKIPEGSSISIDDLLSTDMSGINISDKKIVGIDVQVKYNSPTGSKQTIKVILQTSTGQYDKMITLIKGENTSTANFTELSIEPGTEFTISVDDNKLTNHQITISGVSIVIHFEQ